MTRQYSNYIFATILFFSTCFLPSCALLGVLTEPDLQKEKEERFKSATGHDLLKLYTEEDQLGYVFDHSAFVKKTWGGRKVVATQGQNIKLTYRREDFDKVKLFLGKDFSVGPSLENIHYMTVNIENIEIHRLADIQPLIEYMGKEHEALLRKDFIVSMIKAAKFTVRAYKKVKGDLGAEYHPYPMVKIWGGTGTKFKRGDDVVGYNVFVGYKLYNGGEWLEKFYNKPRVPVTIHDPKENKVIDRVRARIRGKLGNYDVLPQEFKNQLRLYIMTRDEYEDDWILQSKATVKPNGHFEGIVKLGTLEEGNGHRYAIAAFVTYFKINREVNTKIPNLPFDKGKHIIYVKREDDF